MRKNLIFAGLFALVASLGVIPVKAEEEKKFDISGEVRARWEYTENTLDANDDLHSDNGDFFPYRARIAAHGTFSDHVFGHIEFQNFGFFGDESPGKSTGTPLGQATSSSGHTNLYQGYLQLDELWGSAWGARIGRQEHTLGNELQLGDGDFYNGVSFDGVRVMRNSDKWDLNVFYYVTADSAPTLNDQTDLWGATVDFRIGDDGQHVEPYLIGKRNTVPHPNKSSIWTLGALYARPWSKDHSMDWSAEFAAQKGDGPDDGSCTDPAPTGKKCDVSAWIAEGWFGYTFSEHHRIHIGGLWASGDDDPLDNDSENWVQLFPDDHANNRLGDLDLFGGGGTVGSTFTGGGISNINDINVGYTWMGDKNRFMASLHNLTLAQEVVFSPTVSEDAIGNEIDLSWDHKYTDTVAFQVGVASLMVDNVIDQGFGTPVTNPSADDVMRGWAQVRLRWN